MNTRKWMPLVLLLLALSCSRVSKREARAMINRYNTVVCEAYRKGDIQIIDSVVGLDTPDGKRLTGLIGVRQDMGLALDAHLESLEVTGVEQAEGDLNIRTKETWTYRDVKADTGLQVGEASRDRYEVLYRFKKQKGAWLVAETQFTSAPQVGRKEAPWSLDAKDVHGVITTPQAEGKKP